MDTWMKENSSYVELLVVHVFWETDTLIGVCQSLVPGLEVGLHHL